MQLSFQEKSARQNEVPYTFGIAQSTVWSSFHTYDGTYSSPIAKKGYLKFKAIQQTVLYLHAKLGVKMSDYKLKVSRTNLLACRHSSLYSQCCCWTLLIDARTSVRVEEEGSRCICVRNCWSPLKRFLFKLLSSLDYQMRIHLYNLRMDLLWLYHHFWEETPIHEVLFLPRCLCHNRTLMTRHISCFLMYQSQYPRLSLLNSRFRTPHHHPPHPLDCNHRWWDDPRFHTDCCPQSLHSTPPPHLQTHRPHHLPPLRHLPLHHRRLQFHSLHQYHPHSNSRLCIIHHLAFAGRFDCAWWNSWFHSDCNFQLRCFSHLHPLMKYPLWDGLKLVRFSSHWCLLKVSFQGQHKCLCYRGFE